MGLTQTLRFLTRGSGPTRKSLSEFSRTLASDLPSLVLRAHPAYKPVSMSVPSEGSLVAYRLSPPDDPFMVKDSLLTLSSAVDARLRKLALSGSRSSGVNGVAGLVILFTFNASDSPPDGSPTPGV